MKTPTNFAQDDLLTQCAQDDEQTQHRAKTTNAKKTQKRVSKYMWITTYLSRERERERER